MKFSLVTRAILLNVKAELKAVKDEIDYQTSDKLEFVNRVLRIAVLIAAWLVGMTWLAIPKMTKLILDPNYTMSRTDFFELVCGIGIYVIAILLVRRMKDY